MESLSIQSNISIEDIARSNRIERKFDSLLCLKARIKLMKSQSSNISTMSSAQSKPSQSANNRDLCPVCKNYAFATYVVIYGTQVPTCSPACYWRQYNK